MSEHPTVAELIEEMRTIAMVAGQCSVEGPDDTKAHMAAAEAERAGRWADELDALVRASSPPPPVSPDSTTTLSRASERSDAGARQDLREVPDTKGSKR